MFIAVRAAGQEPIYKNRTAPLDDRVNDLIGRMTLEEKINMLGGLDFETKLNKRLGIPALRMTDGPLGVRWGKSTAFPAGICVAATWNPSLAGKVGAAIGREVKGHDRHVILGPCVNIARIPQGGRNFESYGEDPYLASRMTVEYIKGVQSEGVASTAKHFACNNQEYQRHIVDVKIDERTLNEIYLPAFKAAVQEANVLCIMSAYNKVNGHYASENDYLLIDKLKKEWGFNWLVMSDWDAVHSTIPTANSGLDLEMPFGVYLNTNTLMDAVKNGEVKESTIDAKIRRILRVMFTLGLFEKQSLKDETLLGSKENRDAALETAKEGIVLLQNKDNILPLDFSKFKSIAVIGPNATVCRSGGGGSSMVDPIEALSPLDILREKFGGKVKINYAPSFYLGGDAVPVGEKFLSTDNGEEGLLGQYFDNMELKGKPAFERVDKTVYFYFEQVGPREDFPTDNYSVRWTGKMTAPESGDYLLEFTSDDGIRAWLNDVKLLDRWDDHPRESDTVKVKLEANKSYKIKIEYYQHSGGAVAKFGWYVPEKDSTLLAIEAAKNSDAAILFVGNSASIETEGIDRDNLILPKAQDSLISEIANVNKNTIVVLTTGSPVLMDRWLGNVKAVVETWFGGQEMSYAIADVLSGAYNPSGKLPISFPKRWEDCSAFETYKAKDKVTEYSDGIFVGYRHFDGKKIEPLFPFGFGLSYTSFQYDSIMVTENASASEPSVEVSFRVTNVGSRDGAEAAQVYVSDKVSSVSRPPKELKGFKKIFLKAGESKDVNITLKKNAFAFYDVNTHQWIVEPGEFDVLVGSSSKDIRLHKTIHLQ